MQSGKSNVNVKLRDKDKLENGACFSVKHKLWKPKSTTNSTKKSENVFIEARI